MLKQFANAVPAHAEFLQLDRELAAQEPPDTRNAARLFPAASVSVCALPAPCYAGLYCSFWTKIDVALERKILKALLDLKPRPTIVMIAHREQSLALCDRRLRLQNGRAVAEEPALTG